MTTRDLLRARLYFQKLNQPAFKTPADMVRYFGAVQAQDYFGSLWAVGQRTIDANEQVIETALADKSIVRSWPMRGTIHFTAPEDLRWMLDLLGQRIINKAMPTRLETGLTKKDLVKGRSVIEKEMAGGKILERNEVYDLLERNRIKTENSRGLHILGHLALEKVVCCGPRSGKQPTFVLLDDWIKEKKILGKEESMAELASRYFISHGPATVHDFAWWSGMTITEARKAVSMIQSKVQKMVVDGVNYWMSPEAVPGDPVKSSFRLLPSYDEFLVSYADRSAAETEDSKKLTNRGQAIFTSVVIANGYVVGTWKRTVTNKGVNIKIEKLGKMSKQTEAGIKKEMKRYANFIGAKLLS